MAGPVEDAAQGPPGDLDGAVVVLLEALEEFLPMADERIARDSLKIFQGQGLDIRLGTRVTGAGVEGGVS